ncbi:hypothetical protein ACS0TY_020220 [Phlomoides rotata]
MKVGFQSEELNRSGELFIGGHLELNIKVIDGSSMILAVVLNTIPRGTTQILFRGVLCKVAFTIVSALCEQGIQVAMLYEDKKLQLCARTRGNVVINKA